MRAGATEAGDGLGVAVGPDVSPRPDAGRQRHAGGPDVLLGGVGQTEQRRQGLGCLVHDPLLGGAGLGAGDVVALGDDRVDRRVHVGDAVDEGAEQLDRRELPLADPAGERDGRGVEQFVHARSVKESGRRAGAQAQPGAPQRPATRRRGKVTRGAMRDHVAQSFRGPGIGDAAIYSVVICTWARV